MLRTLIAVALATAVMGAASADAAGRKHKRGYYAHPAYTHVVRTPQVGPIWSGPNQCWTDEGYGRFTPCNGRR